VTPPKCHGALGNLPLPYPPHSLDGPTMHMILSCLCLYACLLLSLGCKLRSAESQSPDALEYLSANTMSGGVSTGTDAQSGGSVNCLLQQFPSLDSKALSQFIVNPSTLPGLSLSVCLSVHLSLRLFAGYSPLFRQTLFQQLLVDEAKGMSLWRHEHSDISTPDDISRVYQ